MSYLFDYGEGLLCFLPVFAIIAFIFGALVWNNLPERTVKKKDREEENSDGH
jgi:hypothetical protein